MEEIKNGLKNTQVASGRLRVVTNRHYAASPSENKRKHVVGVRKGRRDAHGSI